MGPEQGAQVGRLVLCGGEEGVEGRGAAAQRAQLVVLGAVVGQHGEVLGWDLVGAAAQERRGNARPLPRGIVQRRLVQWEVPERLVARVERTWKERLELSGQDKVYGKIAFDALHQKAKRLSQPSCYGNCRDIRLRTASAAAKRAIGVDRALLEACEQVSLVRACRVGGP